MMKIKDKALRVIDALVSDDFCTDIEMRKLHPPVILSQEETDLLCKKIGVIYRIAHSVDEDATCYDVHADWRKELETIYRKFKRGKII